MSRIVDAEAFGAQYPFAAADRTDKVAITLEDAQAAWNQGRFVLRIDPDGSARLTREGDGGAGAAQGVSCDIAALTALLTGGRSAEWLRRIGRLQGASDAVAALERRIPKQNPYLADFY